MTNQIRIVMSGQLNTPPYQFVTWSVYNQPDNTGSQSGFFGQLINIAADYIIDPNQTLNPISLVVSGDLSGSLPNPSVSGLQGKPVSSTAPTVGQTLIFNGTTWVPSAAVVSAVGGDLFGSLPNPTVIKIQGTQISSVAPTSGQNLTYNGVRWTAIDPTVNFGTQVLTCGGLTTANAAGMSITTTGGNLTLDAQGFNTSINGNTMDMTSSNSLNVQANSNINLNSDNNSTYSTGGNLSVNGGINLSLSSGIDFAVQVNNNYNINVDNNMSTTTGGTFTLNGGGITISNQGSGILINDPAGGGITIDCNGGGGLNIVAGSGTIFDTAILELTSGAASPIIVSAQGRNTASVAGYDFSILGSNNLGATSIGGLIQINPGTGTSFNGNVAFHTTPSSLAGTAGGSRTIWIGDRSTAPGTNPSGGLILYSESGVAKIRSGANTVTLGNKPAVTGSKASGAALASLLTILATAGIILDSTTA